MQSEAFAGFARLLNDAGMQVLANGIVILDGFSYGILKEHILESGTIRADLEHATSFDVEPQIHRLVIEMDNKRAVHINGVSLTTGKIDEHIVDREMPKSIVDLASEFETLFPDYKSQLYYDVLKEREMIDMAMLGAPEEGFIPINDAVVSEYHLEVQRLLRCKGYLGSRFPTVQVMDEVLTIMVRRTRRNHFKEWVESHEWDGKPRLRRALIDYMGAAAPLLRNVSDSAEDGYLEAVSEAWFLGAIARMYRPCQHDIVPVFIGPQGIGKGTALRFLAGSNEWYAATTTDISRLDRFLDSVRGAVIVEMSESTQIRNRSSQEELKAFISKSEDRLRKAYARHDEIYPRHFILAATSNDGEVFSDPTGARRFYPIICDPDRCTKPIPIGDRWPSAQKDVEQIWAEALYLYMEGRVPSMSKKENELARMMQKDATDVDPSIQALDEWLDSMPLYSMKGARICRKTILMEYFDITGEKEIPQSVSNIWKGWVRYTDKWHKAEKCMDVKGIKTSAAYVRDVDAGDESIEIKTFDLRYTDSE